MLSFLKRILSSFGPPTRQQDADFGQITYDSDGYWCMDGDWQVPFQNEGISCAAIPGDKSGPRPEARAFLLSKKSKHEDIWALCEPFVLECMSGWDAFQGLEPRDVFFISSINMDGELDGGWEICFETRKGMKWVYFCLQIEADDVVSNTVTT